MRTERQAGKTLLLVEDQPVTREALAYVFQSEGYRVVTAANGQEALGRLRAPAPPSLVLMDMRVPAGANAHFLEERKHDDVLGSVPVVLLTEPSADPEWVASLGANGAMPKPVTLDGLIALIHRCG